MSVGVITEVSALVLSVQSWSNTSQTVRLLSDEHGAQHYIARGSRRMSADFRHGPLDVFQWGTAHLQEGKKQHALVGFSALSSFPALSEQHERLLVAFHMLDMLREALVPAPQPGVLRLAVESLAAFEHGDEELLEAALLRFELRLLVLLGRAPLLEVCALCNRAAPAERPARLDPLRGGLVCQACVRGDAARLTTLTVATRRALRELVASTDPRAAVGILAENSVRTALRPLLRMLVGLSFEHPLPRIRLRA